MKIIGKKLAFIIAHPDDESFLASGTIKKNSEAKGQSFVLCATLGERGVSHLKEKISKTKLKQIRKAELVSASQHLGVTELLTFKFPDAELKDHSKELYNELLPVVKKIDPDFVISFGEDGISGHLDHVTIGEVAKSISKKLKKPFLAFARPPKLRKQAKHWFGKKRKEGRYLDDFEYRKPHIKVLIDGKVKIKAIRFHKSQLDGNRPFAKIPKFAADEMLKAEYYVDHSRS